MKKDPKVVEDISKLDASHKKPHKQEAVAQAIKKTEEDLATANDKYLRLYSEFENFRRRAAKEKLTLIETASANVIVKLLPIVDDFERALLAIQANEATADSTQAGIQLIYDKLLHLLQQANVRPMEVKKGVPFDAELHEAITQMPTEEAMKGKVIDVIEKGYLLQDQVLRFAKVVTGA